MVWDPKRLLFPELHLEDTCRDVSQMKAAGLDANVGLRHTPLVCHSVLETLLEQRQPSNPQRLRRRLGGAAHRPPDLLIGEASPRAGAHAEYTATFFCLR